MVPEKERLFLKKMNMENIGRFYGSDHSIIFSDSSEKNITIIIGNSGLGKSTIHHMIYWCLYGEHKKSHENEDQELDYGLINSDALEKLSKGENVTASVTLYLHDDTKEKYVLTRYLKARYNRDSTSRRFETLNNSHVSSGLDFETSVKLQMKNELKKEPEIQKNISIIRNEINRYFPQHLSDFFLFDGENLLKFGNNSSSDFIKNGITKISGLEILKSVYDSAKITANKIEKHIGGKSATAAPFIRIKDEFDERISKLEQEIKQHKTDLDKAKKHHEEISEKIRNTKEGRNLIEGQKKAEMNKNNSWREYRQNNEKIRNTLFEKIPQLLIRDTLRKSEEIFGRLEDEDKIPPSISRGAIDKILDSDPLCCVCGREFEKNENKNSPWMILNQIKDVIIEDDLSQGISQGRYLISGLIDIANINKTRREYNELLDKRYVKDKEIKQFNAEIEDFTRQIKDNECDTAEDLGTHKEEYWKKCMEHSSDINIKQSDLADLKSDREKNDSDLEVAYAKEGKYENERKKISLAWAVNRFAIILEKRIEEILRNHTEKATSNYFLESAPEKETFDRVNISQRYDIVVKDSSNLSCSLSKGQAHVLGLSYVAGIREITHTNTFLIIDSPLHNISGKARNEISEVFSKYLPGVQIILLVTDTEYLHGDDEGAKSVKSILREKGRIWKEYEIDVKDVDGIHGRQIKEYV